jgi:hypothetical protein
MGFYDFSSFSMAFAINITTFMNKWTERRKAVPLEGLASFYSKSTPRLQILPWRIAERPDARGVKSRVFEFAPWHTVDSEPLLLG